MILTINREIQIIAIQIAASFRILNQFSYLSLHAAVTICIPHRKIIIRAMSHNIDNTRFIIDFTILSNHSGPSSVPVVTIGSQSASSATHRHSAEPLCQGVTNGVSTTSNDSTHQKKNNTTKSTPPRRKNHSLVENCFFLISFMQMFFKRN